MAQVNLYINGYNYLVGCEDGQEGHLSAMAQLLQRRIDSVKAIGQQGEARLLLLASLLLADDLHDKEAALAEAHAAIQAAPATMPAPVQPAAAVQPAPEPEIVYVTVIDPEFDATVQRLAAKAEEIADALERA
ncbi:cell division protein ZapA [Acidisoma cellulosilytica]|uniref:Cell division protein ZapA n=1 Tax=Acidisoma cellulosilyticum TaxID=2802395 RepID=A0A964E5Z3_9PROT|nr:cell division protein ZapA [Acidisoma cellulosilyticum]MCB8882468.1 cell division protein ZapA [Acidisoma cellulosilyticum]